MVTATAAGNGQVIVTFDELIYDGGSPIAGFIVTSNCAGQMGSGQIAIGTASPITVTGLDSLQTYTFTVQAINSVGTGPASVPSNSVTPIGGTTSNFVDNWDGTVTDMTTGLMWQQYEPGQMAWEEALTYCENLQWANYDDWRLPNVYELQTLIENHGFPPTINATAFPFVMWGGYWSSTTDQDPKVAWLVEFMYGGIFNYYKSNSYYVRAVRGGGP